MTFPFKREPESGLIVVAIEIDDKYELKMVLDTGATNTTIDSNALYLLGHDLKRQHRHCSDRNSKWHNRY